jgi:hypothetical protein
MSTSLAKASRFSSFLRLMKNEWPSWFAWKVYDTLFTIFIVLTIKHASNSMKPKLKAMYDFLGWE